MSRVINGNLGAMRIVLGTRALVVGIVMEDGTRFTRTIREEEIIGALVSTLHAFVAREKNRDRIFDLGHDRGQVDLRVIFLGQTDGDLCILRVTVAGGSTDAAALNRHEAAALLYDLRRIRAMPASQPAPRHPHDCDACTYLGHHDEYDLYHCTKQALPTVIARYGEDGDYTSGISLQCPPLAEAVRRAGRRGLPLGRA